MEAAAIWLENVSFGYPGRQVLQEINFTVKKGEHIGIVGKSGCGKSTLLKMMAGLYRVQQGKLMIEGETQPEEIRARVSVVMQNPGLFPATIRKNISCGHEMSEDKIRAACAAASLTGWLMSLPEGLDTFVGERGTGVSGGQAQRIAVARAIARDAPVFLLDEVTSALDGNTSDSLLSNLEELTEGKTVVHVAHRPEVLKACSKLWRLEGGRLYAQTNA